MGDYDSRLRDFYRIDDGIAFKIGIGDSLAAFDLQPRYGGFEALKRNIYCCLYPRPVCAILAECAAILAQSSDE